MHNPAETVILIHGLWMPGLVMLPHQRWLRAEGFRVKRFSWPSWRSGLDDNVSLLSRFIAATPGDVVHLFAHSLGGLLTLTLLSRQSDRRIGRVVLMGSPCAGCHCGHTIVKVPGLSGVVGRTFKDWFAAPRPALSPSMQVGILAGTRRIGLGRVIPGLPRPNDGLIALEETNLPIAKDRIALDVSHSGMLVSRACAAQIAEFLRAGHFIRD